MDNIIFIRLVFFIFFIFWCYLIMVLFKFNGVRCGKFFLVKILLYDNFDKRIVNIYISKCGKNKDKINK